MPRRRDQKTCDAIFMVEQETYLPTLAHIVAACNLIRQHTGIWENPTGKGRPMDMAKLCRLIQFNLDRMAQGTKPKASTTDLQTFLETGLHEILGEQERRWIRSEVDSSVSAEASDQTVLELVNGGKHHRYMRLASDITWIIVSDEWQESITDIVIE